MTFHQMLTEVKKTNGVGYLPHWPEGTYILYENGAPVAKVKNEQVDFVDAVTPNDMRSKRWDYIPF